VHSSAIRGGETRDRGGGVLLWGGCSNDFRVERDSCPRSICGTRLDSAQDGDSVVCAPRAERRGTAASEHHAQSVPHHTSPLQHGGGVRAERYVQPT
jgi:hypothetical protein